MRHRLGHDAAQTVAMVGGDQTEAVLMVGNLVVKGGTHHTTPPTITQQCVAGSVCLSLLLQLIDSDQSVTMMMCDPGYI